MKRAERSEYTYIKNYERQFDLGYGTTLTIRTNGSAEYKKYLLSVTIADLEKKVTGGAV